ncbi:MAG: helix-turn-helix domain-containing protein [Oscillospiraceae bacterium]|nr:helix-turn-helix domain-containing protein [Oscillospiraceae bacterium]
MDQMKVGKFIAALRKEQGLTQEALGEKLGVTNKTVSRWENGNYMPDIELLVPLGELLGVSVNELLAGERLSDEQFRKQADENLVKAVRESAFTVMERRKFFRKKWRRDHLGLILVLMLAAVLVTVKLSEYQLAAFVWVFPMLVVFWENNSMMSYVEGRVHDNPKPPKDS